MRHAHHRTDLASPRPRPVRVAPREPLGQVAALTMLGLILGLVVCAACLSGCGIAAEDARLIDTAASVADADLAEWDRLTPEQRKRALWRSARAWHRLAYSLTDSPLAAEWDVAPATTDAETGRGR